MKNQLLTLVILSLCASRAMQAATKPFMEAYQQVVATLQEKNLGPAKLTQHARRWKKQVLTFTPRRAQKCLIAAREIGSRESLPLAEGSFLTVYQQVVKQKPDQAAAVKDCLLTVDDALTVRPWISFKDRKDAAGKAWRGE